MIDSKPLNTQISSRSSLSRHDVDTLPEPFLYRNIIGALQYLMHTRPELAFAINCACQLMQSPTTTHWSTVKRTAGCLDDCRSTTGYCIFLSDNLIS
ncbi:uncharacterized mitochondrial protein AtMg00810-like [Impatiens glandulifera]|uniref:uncharacterized mitochondrial protein AtMg00810-like n=1 Tax=Impatiens glandulifera TaxID=253017 RepID=UPI001FB0E957|nr:uncharacterized mitochondrial protein AtMg00810-like [Impatiens glandulifera]